MRTLLALTAIGLLVSPQLAEARSFAAREMSHADGGGGVSYSTFGGSGITSGVISGGGVSGGMPTRPSVMPPTIPAVVPVAMPSYPTITGGTGLGAATSFAPPPRIVKDDVGSKPQILPVTAGPSSRSPIPKDNVGVKPQILPVTAGPNGQPQVPQTGGGGEVVVRPRNEGPTFVTNFGGGAGLMPGSPVVCVFNCGSSGDGSTLREEALMQSTAH